ncbi:oligosaccharide flippase family protein [Clostridium perfringens]|uniref:oligosaccharide flippase family protein n=1 Tax=Clostridium perfringens TaxID=1502 RepID=UPI0032E38141
MSDGKNTISRTLIISILAMGMNYLISLVLTSYITEHISSDAYGFVSLAKNISSYAIIFTSCLNAYSSRYITISYHRDNKEKANIYYSSVFYANIVLSIVMLLMALIGIIYINKILNVPYELLNQVRILLFLDFCNYMILSTGSCFTVYAYISDKLDLMNLVKFISYFVEAIILLVLFLGFAPSIIYVGIGLLVSSIVYVFGNYIAVRKYVPGLKTKFKFLKLKAIKDLVFSGIWNSINSIGSLLQSGLDLIASNLMLSTVAMGQLSVVKTLSTIFTTLFQLLATPFQPKLLTQYSNNNLEGVVSTLKVSMKISGFFSTLLFAGFFGYGKLYYHLWTPGQNISLLQQLTVITFLGSAIEGIIFPLFYTYTLTLKNKIPCFITIISGLFNVVGMYVLIKYFNFGLSAVVLTTTVLGWGTYLIFTPLYVSKCLKCPLGTFYPTIFRILTAGGIMTIFIYLMSLVKPSISWMTLILRSCISVIVCIPIYFFIIFSREELKKIKELKGREERNEYKKFDQKNNFS